MKPFEKALIQAILEEYGDIYSAVDQTCNPKFQNRNGLTNINEGIDKYLSNAELTGISLWINMDDKKMYLSRVNGTTQYVFRNQDSRTACIDFLTKLGFSIQTA